MKKFVLAAMLILLTGYFSSAPAQSNPPSTDERAVVGAILIPNQDPMNGDGKYEMICSGVETGYDGDGNGIFVTARHCVFDEGTNTFYKGEVVSFKDDGSAPYYPAALYRISSIDDLAVLKLQGAASVPRALIEPESSLNPGDPIDNVSYPEDMGKVEFHGAFVAPVWPHRPRYTPPEWAHGMPADITILPGSSGSPIFDAKTHCVVGIAVGIGESRLAIIEPISLLLSTVSDGSIEKFVQSHPPKVYFPPTQDLPR